MFEELGRQAIDARVNYEQEVLQTEDRNHRQQQLEQEAERTNRECLASLQLTIEQLGVEQLLYQAADLINLDPEKAKSLRLRWIAVDALPDVKDLALSRAGPDRFDTTPELRAMTGFVAFIERKKPGNSDDVVQVIDVHHAGEIQYGYQYREDMPGTLVYMLAYQMGGRESLEPPRILLATEDHKPKRRRHLPQSTLWHEVSGTWDFLADFRPRHHALVRQRALEAGKPEPEPDPLPDFMEINEWSLKNLHQLLAPPVIAGRWFKKEIGGELYKQSSLLSPDLTGIDILHQEAARKLEAAILAQANNAK